MDSSSLQTSDCAGYDDPPALGIRSHFAHYGQGSPNMLGWNTFKNHNDLPLFNFGKHDKKTMWNQFREDQPRERYNRPAEISATIKSPRSCSQTARPPVFRILAIAFSISSGTADSSCLIQTAKSVGRRPKNCAIQTKWHQLVCNC